MKKPELIDFLKATIAAIEADDSYEGRITYTFGTEPGTFKVDAAIRVGNSLGQGGLMLINESLEN